ncbi:MAG: hypothetical protein ACI8Z5_002727 [Lentimonas sp.]|jgi:hypothetical protein
MCPILKSTLSLGGLLCVSGLATSLSAAINITGFDPLVNDRFANDASFIASGFDLSGVAIADDGRWITMLSSNVFVTANHFASPVNTSVTFYNSNDPLGGSFNTTIQSSQQLGGTDIQLGVLSTALPTSYNAYDLFNDPIPPNSNPVALAMFGRSPSAFPGSQDMAIGQNVLDTFTANQNVSGNTGDAGSATFDSPGDPFFLAYEAQLAVGDSGAPVMVNDDGELTIIGVNWYIGTTTDDPAQEVSGFSYLPNYISDIDAFILANDITPFPEPITSALLIGLVIASTTLSRRRRSVQI